MLAIYIDGLTMGPQMEKALTNANPTERLATVINYFLYFNYNVNVLYFCTFFTIHFLDILKCICIPNIVLLLYCFLEINLTFVKSIKSSNLSTCVALPLLQMLTFNFIHFTLCL